MTKVNQPTRKSAATRPPAGAVGFQGARGRLAKPHGSYWDQR